jgi:signal transduction histidine kinase/CheY-like chemotaxis protein
MKATNFLRKAKQRATLYVALLLALLLGRTWRRDGRRQGLAQLHQQAERDATELAKANEALQREIAERKRAQAAEHEQRELAEALREVGAALSATLNFDELLDCLLDQIARVLPYDTANVMLVEGQEAHIVCARGYEPHVQRLIPRRFALADLPSLQQMAKTSEPLVIPDTAIDSTWVKADVSPHVRSWAGAPITIKRQVVAFLALNNSQPGFYQPKDATRLAAFAGQAAIAVQNARLYQRVRKRVDELTALNEISLAISSTLDLQKTLARLTDYTTRLLGVAATSVVLHDKEMGDLWFAAASGEASDFVRGKRLPIGQGFLGWVAQHGEPLLITDALQDERHFGEFDEASGFTAYSVLCVPLRTKRQIIGAIEALNKEDGPFEEDDLRLLTLLATPAATAIENAQLYEQAQQEINERKRAEADLEAERSLLARRVAERTADLSMANAELARAARLKDEFLASMSHELRTPLNAVLGISEALQECIYGPLNEKQIQALKSVEESGRHLLELINDILDLSKIEAGKLELEIRPVSIEAVCQASLRLIKQDAHKKRLKVSSTIESPVATMQADERRLKQILVNLLSNAVKFTPEGGEVGLEVRGDEEAKVFHFTVWDTGIGIATEDMPRLFRPFVQLDSALARQYTGTGLGLSLVYRMTELHSGGVAVTSEAGQGSRFTISLPWPEAMDNDPVHSLAGQPAAWRPLADDRAQSQTAVTSHSDQRAPAGKQPLILLVEDNEANIETISPYLVSSGYRVTTARNGREAIERALEDAPDVILMDVQMPGMDGLEATRRIRANSALAAAPIIALTALAMAGDRERCLAAGATAYLSKPVSLRGLVEVIDFHLKEFERVEQDDRG